MGFFKIIGTKPWLPGPDNAPPEERTPPQTVALRFFLGVVGVLFALFIVAYYIRMELNDWRPMPESPLLWLNTLILLMSSVVLQWTCHSLTRENLKLVRIGQIAGGLLTLAFIFGQLLVWDQMSSRGYIMYNNPANSFFYVLTGIHGLHLLGGLWVWTAATFKTWSGKPLAQIKLSVELCALYWHFLLIIWLVLFALLSYT